MVCKNDKGDHCGDTLNWKYSLGRRKKYGMDKTKTALKTSLKHCIAGWNAILTTSIAMLTPFHRYRATIRVFAIFLCQRNVLRRRKREMKNKGESNLTKNHQE